MVECEKLTVMRQEVEKEQKIGECILLYLLLVLNPKSYDGEMGEWQARHFRGREKGKGDVGVEKKKEKEEQKGEKMESLFCSIFEILTDAAKFDVTSSLCNNADLADDVGTSSDTYAFPSPSKSSGLVLVK